MRMQLEASNHNPSQSVQNLPSHWNYSINTSTYSNSTYNKINIKVFLYLH